MRQVGTSVKFSQQDLLLSNYFHTSVKVSIDQSEETTMRLVITSCECLFTWMIMDYADDPIHFCYKLVKYGGDVLPKV